jgi:hypothetical protein
MNTARRDRPRAERAGGLLTEGTGYEKVKAILLESEAEHRFGVVRVAGEPGGLIYLADGGVLAIETAGAPGADVVLLRSGRVREPEWTAAFTSAAAPGRLAAELVNRELIGRAELEAVLRVVLADAMFAVACGLVDECAFEQVATPGVAAGAGTGSAPVLLPLTPPASPTWLLAETARRLEVLAEATDLVRHDRDRVTADPLGPGVMLSVRQQELAALANGRRTPRDLAFITGRGVYALSLELTRMHRADLVTITSQRAIRPAGEPADQPAGPDDAPEVSVPALPPPPLPRRTQPGRQPRPGPAEIAPPPSSALHRLLRLFPSADHDSGGVTGADTEG